MCVHELFLLSCSKFNRNLTPTRGRRLLESKFLNRLIDMLNNAKTFALALVLGCSVGVFQTAQAAVFQLPTNGDSIVGQFQHVTLTSSDTFADIARRYDVGFNELVAANPKVDPWLPAEGTQIVIPTQFALPNEPWKGIVVNIAEMRLYYFPKTEGVEFPMVYTFPIGIGRENWETPLGNFKVTEKMENPVWTVPQSVLDEAKREGREIPVIVPPGPDNPLGAHALMLSKPGYFIHGTNKPFTIGRRVSHGCLRLYPEDIEQLVRSVPRGIPVKIIDKSVTAGRKDSVLYIEAHPPIKASKNDKAKLRAEVTSTVKKYSAQKLNQKTWKRIYQVASQLSGIPVPVADLAKSPRNEKWILRVESSLNGKEQQPLVMRFKDLALPILNGQCDPFQTCIDLGLFNSAKLRDATAEFIKYGFGLGSANLLQNAKISDNGL